MMPFVIGAQSVKALYSHTVRSITSTHSRAQISRKNPKILGILRLSYMERRCENWKTRDKYGAWVVKIIRNGGWWCNEYMTLRSIMTNSTELRRERGWEREERTTCDQKVSIVSAEMNEFTVKMI